MDQQVPLDSPKSAAGSMSWWQRLLPFGVVIRKWPNRSSVGLANLSTRAIALRILAGFAALSPL
jgi:hypothetical protein